MRRFWSFAFLLFVLFSVNSAEIFGTNLDLVKFVFFYGTPTNKVSTQYSFQNVTDVLDHPFFDADKVLVIYIHGWLETTSTNSTQTVMSSYLQNGSFNTLILDWGPLAAGSYSIAAQNVFKVGPATAVALQPVLENHRLTIDKLHLVGHSMGGQMVGVIGDELQKRSNGAIKLDRITALDPAGHEFGVLGLRTITPKDASFVDIIHTDAGNLGYIAAGGTVDFWPNGGKAIQPGCPTFSLDVVDWVACSHQRSWGFFSASLVTPGPFVFQSIAAASWSDFQRGRTNASNTALMGVNVQRTASGNYYLRTGPTTPFTLGADGIHN